MKKKKITVNINSTYKFLQVWNGIFNLTNKELEILSAFIDTNAITGDENLCSVSIKDHNTLNNYIKKFKDKGVFIKEGNNYTTNSLLDTDTNIIEIEFRRL